MKIRLLSLLGAFTTGLVLSSVAAAQEGPTARFSALAVDMTAAGNRPATTPVTITISRWSSDAERDTLMNALLERGPDAALAAIRDLPRAGSIAASGSVGIEVRFARRISEPSGTERIVLVTDRPVSFWERRAGDRSTDYPFTLIDLRVGADGKGEGKVSVATKIIVDPATKSLVLENYADQPVLLQSVLRIDDRKAAR